METVDFGWLWCASVGPANASHSGGGGYDGRDGAVHLWGAVG